MLKRERKGGRESTLEGKGRAEGRDDCQLSLTGQTIDPSDPSLTSVLGTPIY